MSRPGGDRRGAQPGRGAQPVRPPDPHRDGARPPDIPALSAYAFSTENWRRSPDEVRFLMGFNRDVIRRRRDQLHEMGVRVRWAGRRPRLWRSVISELADAERLTAKNDVLTLQFC